MGAPAAAAEDEEDPPVPDTGAVFTFGKSKFAENAPSKFWIKRDCVVQLSCGDEHTAVATASGRLFTFGGNEWGQLGLGHRNNVQRPSCVKSLKPDRATLVACGKTHTVVAMASGRVVAFGSNAEGQLGAGREHPEGADKPVDVRWPPGITTRALALSAGVAHSMALVEGEGGRRQVLVWGGNTEGQLGLGDDAEEAVFVPTVLDLREELEDVVAVSCGYYHSAVVTLQGGLYTFGDAEGGRLGLPFHQQLQQVDTPTKVELPPFADKIVSVSCGGSHTVALSSSGQAFSFGQSSNGQLGLGTETLESWEPAFIQTLWAKGHVLVQVSCGESHTAAVSDKGRLFTFGDGRHGKLCLDIETMTNHYRPAFSTRFQGFKVTGVHCGGCHTMVHAVPDAEAAEGGGGDGSDPMSSADATVNGSLEEINVAARLRHRRESEKRLQLLPPIRHAAAAMTATPEATPAAKAAAAAAALASAKEEEDPEEIVNIGSELVEVNGNGTGEEEKEVEDDDKDEVESVHEEEEEEEKEESARTEREEGKKPGKIMSFFRGLSGRRRGGEIKNGGETQSGSKEEEVSDQDDDEKDEKDEEDEEEEEKVKRPKRVTFFSRTKSKDEKVDDVDDEEEEEEDDEKESEVKSHDSDKGKDLDLKGDGEKKESNRKGSSRQQEKKEVKKEKSRKSRTCSVL